MDKLRIGLIGCGGIARRRHAPAIQSIAETELAAICDIDEACVASVTSQFGVKETYSDYREMLEKAEIDAVDICTPNFVHVEAAEAAFQAGKHVFVEKPIARTTAEADRIIAAAREANKKLMVGQCLRFSADAQVLKRFVQAGKMGDIYFARVRAIRRRGIPTHGVFTSKEKQGGGPLIDLGVHWIDYALWLMGHPEPVAVSGATYTKFGNRGDVYAPHGKWDYKNFTVEDFATGFVRFANGTTMSIETSFAANIEKDTMELALMGTDGGCQTNPTRMFREEDGNLYDLTPVSIPETNMYEGEIRAFADSVLNDKPSPVPGEEARKVSQILDGLYQSAETGVEVRIG